MFQVDKENYEQLKLASTEVIEHLKQIKNIEISDNGNGSSMNVEIEQILCCDFKMLGILYGLKGPNSKHACVLCDFDLTQEKEEYNEMGKIYGSFTVYYDVIVIIFLTI